MQQLMVLFPDNSDLGQVDSITSNGLNINSSAGKPIGGVSFDEVVKPFLQLPYGFAANSSFTSVTFQGKIYLFYLYNSTGNFAYLTSVDGINWQGPLLINSNFTSSQSPSAVVFNNCIYVFYVSTDGNKIIYMLNSIDGIAWSTSLVIDSSLTATFNSSAVVMGDTLYLYYSDSTDNLNLVTSSDGINFKYAPDGFSPSFSGALTAIVFNNVFYVFGVSSTSNSYYSNILYAYSSDGGGGWNDANWVGAATSGSKQIGAIVYLDILYIFFLDSGSSGEIYCCAFNGSSWIQYQIAPSSSINTTYSTPCPILVWA